MKTALTIAVLAWLGQWAYKQGKQIGSRGGFRAGWRRGRNSANGPK